jgi:integrase
MSELCTTYIDRHAKPHKRSWKADQRRIDTYIVPALGDRPIREVTRDDVGTLLAAIGERKIKPPADAPKRRGAKPRGGGRTESNRVQALLSVMFECGRDWGLVGETHPNPAHRIKRYRETPRMRFITDDELPALFTALDAEPNPHARAAVELALLTGCRRGELEGLQWSNVDLSGRMLRLGITKNGKPHHVPLSTRASEVLAGLPRFVGNPHVFPSATAPKKALDISGAWQRIRERAGLSDVSFHDLRRSAGSHMASAGVGLGVIGAMLNHASTSTTAIYARITNTAVRDAVEQHGERFRTHEQAAR